MGWLLRRFAVPSVASLLVAAILIFSNYFEAKSAEGLWLKILVALAPIVASAINYLLRERFTGAGEFEKLSANERAGAVLVDVIKKYKSDIKN